MAVTYMLALESEPETYEKFFTQLTKGINQKVQEWILSRIQTNSRILEIGCGPGTLSFKMADQGNDVIAIDSNPKMIKQAMEVLQKNPNSRIEFQEGSALHLSEELGTFDFIVSTFMLSELHPFEQQIFLREIWNHLNPNGTVLLADEFVPNGFARILFNIKRWRYKAKLRRYKAGETHPLEWFENYLAGIGYDIHSKEQWSHNSIRAFELQKAAENPSAKPNFYRPIPHPYLGIKAIWRSLMCILSGQRDQVAIEPGIYQSGHPNPDSPVILTANYEYTYFRVMRDLRGVDAWVLCVDSDGINVWCGSRGGHFGNSQVIQAVQASGIQDQISHREIILPQLAAGGVAVPELTKSIPFKIKYGPIWSRDLKEYLTNRPVRKPEYMRLAKFNWSKRIEAGMTHVTLLLRQFLLWPSIIALIILGLVSILINNSTAHMIMNQGLLLIGWIWFDVILTNIFLFILFPLANMTKVFIKKGLLLSIFTSLFSSVLFWLMTRSLLFFIVNFIFLYWLGFFSTMSFSGYTFATSPNNIRGEFRYFNIINFVLMIISIILYVGAFVIEVM